MSEYNDTNVGVGHAYDSAEEKEIMRLENRLEQRDMEIAKLKAERDQLVALAKFGRKVLSMSYYEGAVSDGFLYNTAKAEGLLESRDTFVETPLAELPENLK